jgi:hypothetical protein
MASCSSHTQTYRVSTGPQHSKLGEVLETIKGIKARSSLEEVCKFEDQLIEKMITLNEDLKTVSKHRLQTKIERVDKKIATWNIRVTKFVGKTQKHNMFPTINTKAHHYTGHVKDLEHDHDDLEMSGEGSQCVLCSHKHGRHNSPCFVIPQSTCFDMLQMYVVDPSKWEIDTTRKFKKGDSLVDCRFMFDEVSKNKSTILNVLCITCPKKKTDHCKTTGVFCNELISLGKMLQMLDTNQRDQLTRNNFSEIKDLFRKVFEKQFPEIFPFCPNKACQWACKSFSATIKMSDNDEENIDCSHCGGHHHVHGHKQTCPDPTCTTTFCSICKMSPYHDNDVCRGPVDADDENSVLIRETTKPCPSCKFRTEKNDGCDHMSCIRCPTHWCWRCLQKLDRNTPYRHKCLKSGVVEGNIDGAYDGWGNEDDGVVEGNIDGAYDGWGNEDDGVVEGNIDEAYDGWGNEDDGVVEGNIDEAYDGWGNEDDGDNDDDN